VLSLHDGQVPFAEIEQAQDDGKGGLSVAEEVARAAEEETAARVAGALPRPCSIDDLKDMYALSIQRRIADTDNTTKKINALREDAAVANAASDARLAKTDARIAVLREESEARMAVLREDLATQQAVQTGNKQAEAQQAGRHREAEAQQAKRHQEKMAILQQLQQQVNNPSGTQDQNELVADLELKLARTRSRLASLGISLSP